jgi:putative Holliday junction resolvase
MGRFAAIDYGTRRIGLALSDPGARIASPVGTLDATGTPVGDARRVLRWAAENEVADLVVGLPLNMHDGSDSAQTTVTRTFAAALANEGNLPVHLWDERLTSFQADQWLEEAGVPRHKRKALRDAMAALAILQNFLASRESDAPNNSDSR